MIDTFDRERDAEISIGLAKASALKRLDSYKSNMERQGDWPLVEAQHVPPLLKRPDLARYIDINPLDTVNPDQDVAPSSGFMLSKQADELNNSVRTMIHIHAPSGKLFGTMILTRL